MQTSQKPYSGIYLGDIMIEIFILWMYCKYREQIMIEIFILKCIVKIENRNSATFPKVFVPCLRWTFDIWSTLCSPYLTFSWKLKIFIHLILRMIWNWFLVFDRCIWDYIGISNPTWVSIHLLCTDTVVVLYLIWKLKVLFKSA